MTATLTRGVRWWTFGVMDLVEVVLKSYGWRELHRYARQESERRGFRVQAEPTVAGTYGGVHVGHGTTWSSSHYRDSLYPDVPGWKGGTDGCGMDFGAGANDCDELFAVFREHAVPGGPIAQLIWQHTIINDGVEGYYSPSDHLDHVHAGIRPDAQLP